MWNGRREYSNKGREKAVNLLPPAQHKMQQEAAVLNVNALDTKPFESAALEQLPQIDLRMQTSAQGHSVA